jgi:hypothetical protein
MKKTKKTQNNIVSGNLGIKNLFRAIAMTTMLGISTIMPMKKAIASEDNTAKLNEVKKPNWLGEKEKTKGPSFTLNLFGGAHHKPVTAPYIGFGGSINQKLGPLSFDVLFESAATSPSKIVLENASFATTFPITKNGKILNIPLSASIYIYRERIAGVELATGFSINTDPIVGKEYVGSFKSGIEIGWPGDVYAVYLVWKKSIADMFSIKPTIVLAKGLRSDVVRIGGKFATTVKLTSNWNADVMIYYMTDPISIELLKINWRVGLTTSF